MRILYVTLYHDAFGMGGAEKVLLELACGMKNHFQEPVACLVNAGELAGHLRAEGIPVFEMPHAKLQTFGMLRQIRKVIDEFQPDIIHSHHRYTTFLLELSLRGKNVFLLHTEHVLRKDKRLFFRCGHLATAVHESVRQNLIRHYGIAQNRVVTIPNAVPAPKVEATQIQKLEAAYPRRAGQIYALCVGRLETQKGHRYLVEALGQMPPVPRQRFKIFLAGEGSLRPDLEKQVARSGLQAQFVFLGHSQEVAVWLSLCDFLVLPSLWEGMPLSILEAYAQQRPVIATDIAGTRDLVAEGKTGILVPARDPGTLAKALGQMADHDESRRAMGEQALRAFERDYSFEQMQKRYHELYTEKKSYA